MTYVCRVSVSYDDRHTKLERLRAREAAHLEMTALLGELDQVWKDSGQGMVRGETPARLSWSPSHCSQTVSACRISQRTD